MSGAVAIRLEVTGLPDGASIKWPDSVKATREGGDADMSGDQKGDIATLTRDKDNSSAPGKFSIYMYSQEDSMFDDTDTAGTEENVRLQPYLALSSAVSKSRVSRSRTSVQPRKLTSGFNGGP